MGHLGSFEGAGSIFADLLSLKVLEFRHFDNVVLKLLKYFLPAFKIYADASRLLLDLRILDRTVGMGLKTGVNKTTNLISGFLQVLFELNADHILLRSVESVVMARLLIIQDVIGQDNFLRTELIRSPKNFLQQIVFLKRGPITDGPVRAGTGSELLDGSIPVEEIRMGYSAGNF